MTSSLTAAVCSLHAPRYRTNRAFTIPTIKFGHSGLHLSWKEAVERSRGEDWCMRYLSWRGRLGGSHDHHYLTSGPLSTLQVSRNMHHMMLIYNLPFPGPFPHRSCRYKSERHCRLSFTILARSYKTAYTLPNSIYTSCLHRQIPFSLLTPIHLGLRYCSPTTLDQPRTKKHYRPYPDRHDMMIVTCRASSSTSKRLGSHALLARRALNPTSGSASQATGLNRGYSSGSGSGSGSGPKNSRRRRYLPIVGLSALAMTLSTASLASSSDHDAKISNSSERPTKENDEEMHATSRDLLPTPAIQSIATSVLIRTYLVYTLCSIPLLIDYAPSLLHSFTHSPVPGLKAVTEAIVRRTFFAQFVPGESVEECLPTMRDLRKGGVGAVLNYSAEVNVEDGGLTDEKRRLFEEKRLKEVEKALVESGRFETQIGEQGLKQGSTSFALKVVSLKSYFISQSFD
jgi:hypothetical protein